MSTDNGQKSKAETIISASCHIKGDISGADDIRIFGKIEGVILLKNNTVTIEHSAKVEADIAAKIVHVNGNIIGNIEAEEKIIITDSGNVTGDMTAPKVILKDGSYFKGNVSMTNTKVVSTPAMQAGKNAKNQTNK